MKQTFIIETKEKLSADELFGCLEDTLGKENIGGVMITGKETNPKDLPNHDKEFIENVFEIAFGDNAINKDYTKKEVLEKIREFSDKSLLEQINVKELIEQLENKHTEFNSNIENYSENGEEDFNTWLKKEIDLYFSDVKE